MRKSTKSDWVQAVLLGLGTVAGATTFWYTDIHRPAITPATLTMTPALETIGRRGKSLLVRASLKIENRSNYRVYVPAFWYSVHGYCYRPRAMTTDSFAAAVRDRPQSRYNEDPSGDLVVTTRPSPSKESFFDPGSERRYEELFLVPADQYSALRMQVRYMVAKDIDEIAEIRWTRGTNGEPGDSVFLKRRYAPRTGEGHFRSTARQVELYDGVRHQDWTDRARAGWGWSHATLSLWPLAGGGGRARTACTR
jgi:hypothetical protein